MFVSAAQQRWISLPARVFCRMFLTTVLAQKASSRFTLKLLFESATFRSFVAAIGFSFIFAGVQCFGKLTSENAFDPVDRVERVVAPPMSCNSLELMQHFGLFIAS